MQRRGLLAAWVAASIFNPVVAAALPVSVEFSGHVKGLITGDWPESVARDAPVSGIFSYEAEDVVEHSLGHLELPGPSVQLSLDVGGVRIENVWEESSLLALVEVVFVDPDDLTVTVPPPFPGALPAVVMQLSSLVVAPDLESLFLFEWRAVELLDQDEIQSNSLPQYVLDRTLPMSATDLADFVDYGEFNLRNPAEAPQWSSNFSSSCGSSPDAKCLSANIRGAMPVPEPSTSSLLLLGMAAVSARSRRTFRNSPLRPKPRFSATRIGSKCATNRR